VAQLNHKIVPIQEAGSGKAAGERLVSWKEIAAYLNRGARTVQRWEREEGLPIHRLRHDKLGSVYAYKSELDAWWNSRRADLESKDMEQEPGPSIAVLPFADMSREKDQGYFCEGIAEEILNALSKVSRLRIASRISAFQFQAGAANSREIGRSLHVAYLLEGSVRKSEGRLRVAVQLTDAENGYQVWSERYDRGISDVFVIQEEIANQVVHALRVKLTPGERAALEEAPAADADAYDYYLRGRKFYYRYGLRDIEYAIQLFTHAIERDPNYALAYAGLADCWSYLFLYGGRNDALRDQADWASFRAIELDPRSAQAQASRGLALSLGRRDAEATEAFDSAIRLDAGLYEAYYFYARHCFSRGRREDAVRLYEEAMRARPEDFQAPLLVAQIYDDLGRPEEARSARLRGVQRAEEHLKLNPDDARARYMGANGLIELGDRERGARWAERALAMRPDDPVLLYNVGCIYSLLGRADEAIHCLENAVSAGLAEKRWLENDTNLAPLRKDIRFQALLGKL
jgi:adenylate cyclase